MPDFPMQRFYFEREDHFDVVRLLGQSALNDVATEFRRGGDIAVAIATDVTDQESVAATAAAVARDFGEADLVFNNAGIMLPGMIEAQHFSEWQQQIGLNITGAKGVIHAFLAQLEAAAGKGKVVDLINTSSIASTS